MGIRFWTVPLAGVVILVGAPRRQTITATQDSEGPHPATATIQSAAIITCDKAMSGTPDVQAPPACKITAPGFVGVVPVGNTVEGRDPGNVILTCVGGGTDLTCSATIQEKDTGKSK